MSRLENQGKLPSQSEVNTKQNVSAMTLRNEKEIDMTSPKVNRRVGPGLRQESETNDPNAIDRTEIVPDRTKASNPTDAQNNKIDRSVTQGLRQEEAEKEIAIKTPEDNKRQPEILKIPPPFPQRYAMNKKDKVESEIFNFLARYN